MHLQNLRLGCNDMEKARAFYDATFGALGLPPSATPREYPIILYKLPGGPNFAVGPARDGNAATHANGGTCEGQPEPKPQARGAFGAYLRDPDGNKLAAYHGLNMG